MKKNEAIQFWLITSLLVGLMFSRALLSVSSVAILVFYFIGKKDGPALKRSLLASIFLIVPVMISFFWSDDKQQWFRAMSEKLPLLCLCVGFAHLNISYITYKQLTWILCALVFVGTIYTSYYYFQNFNEVNEAYLKASVLPTLLDNNHIHFSWLTVLCILLLFQILNNTSSTEKYVAVFVILWFTIFLHVLAAKTGLILLYFVLATQLISLLIQKKKQSLPILLAIVFVITLAALFIPTFQNRLKFVRWDIENVSKGNFLPGLSDGNRWLSIKAGYSVFEQDPAIGTGFGDIKNETDKWISSHHPNIPETERFLPLNQWIIYAAGSGWFGLISFTMGIFLFVSMLIRTRKFIPILTAAVLLAPLFIDDTLETQFGIFIFIFFIFWIRYPYINKYNKPAIV